MTIAAGVAVGALCAASLGLPAVRALEQRFGLQWHFDLRGPVEPPGYAILVLMNERAANAISLPRDPERFHRCEDLQVGARPATHVNLPEMPSRWPRCVHAALLERLLPAGAKVVAFDVLFRERPPLPGAGGDLHAWQDEALARAAGAGRVVIAQKIETQNGHEQFANLSPSIADAVLGAAPFPLLTEAGRRFDRFMVFKETGLATPTLPAIVLQAYDMDGYPALRDFLLRHAGENAILLPESTADLESQGGLQATALLVRNLAQKTLATVEESGSTSEIGALGALYAGESTRLLNVYGPAGTLPSVNYDEVLAALPEQNAGRFAGKAVFVGYGETLRPEQVEHFATVFSRGEGADLSGVEIAATAFSNLVDDRSLRELPLRAWILITFLAGFTAFVLCHALGNRVAIATVLLLVGIYVGVAAYLFEISQLWVPLVLPLAVAVPFAMLTAFGSNFWVAHQQRARLRDAFGHFVPNEVVARLEQNAGDLGGSRESLECACVATDAANYTRLAEAMSPEQLAVFLNRYYESLFGCVANRGGFVSDVVGDAMLAIWPDRSQDTRRRVLHALLEMRDAAEQFNLHVAGNRLYTRFGVDWGRVTLSTVGASVHYEYRAVGDAVNTAARIQELNKHLGTRILVSEAVLTGASGEFLTCNFGRFLLRGKTHAVQIHELVTLRARASSADADRSARVGEAVEVLDRGDLQAARELLGPLHDAHPEDAPVAFLVASIEAGHARDQDAWVIG